MSEDSWNEWKDGFQLPSSWPSEKYDIDVDRNSLNKIGKAMEADLDLVSTERNQRWSELEWPALTPDPGRLNWRTMSHFEKAVFWIARVSRMKYAEARGDYSGIASMVFASSINYDRAEGIVGTDPARLEKAINGVRHETTPTPGPGEREDVSEYDAPMIKEFFDRLDLTKLAGKGELFHDLAKELNTLQDMCQQRAHDLSSSWSSPAAEHALEAMRKLCATFRTLAYTAGHTGDALATLHENLNAYKANFEGIVNLDKTAGESVRDWFFDMDEHYRARNLLLDANARVVEAHHLLPSQIETVLPNVVEIGVKLDQLENGYENFWEHWETSMRNR